MVNLDEFMKVFIIVFTMAGSILFLRHYIVNYDDETPEESNDRINVDFKQNSPDFIDYDGMGNQGRFPTLKNKK